MMKFCNICGNIVDNDSKFCTNCGSDKIITKQDTPPVNNGSTITCTNCGSNNVNIQIVTKTSLKRQHHGCIYWILIGWWLELSLWIFLTIPRFLCMLFGHKKQKIVNKNYKMAVCQSCGHSWKI